MSNDILLKLMVQIHRGRSMGLGSLTLSGQVVSNGYTSNCSGPCWSNPPLL